MKKSLVFQISSPILIVILWQIFPFGNFSAGGSQKNQRLATKSKEYYEQGTQDPDYQPKGGRRKEYGIGEFGRVFFLYIWQKKRR